MSAFCDFSPRPCVSFSILAHTLWSKVRLTPKGRQALLHLKMPIDPTALLMYMVNMRVDKTSISVLRLINLTSYTRQE